MNKCVILAALAGAAIAGQSMAGIELQLVANIDVFGAVDVNNTTSRIGTNVAAVAWTGSQLFIGGANNSGAALNVGLMEVQNPLASPTLGSRFGTLSAAASRGYVGLSVQSGVLASTNQTAASSAVVTTWNTGTSAQIGTRTLGTSAGTAFDPGFAGSTPSAGSLAYGVVGSGRRVSVNPNTAGLTDVYVTGAGPTQGAIWNSIATGSGGMGSQYRDLAFDPVTGDIYGRAANAISKAVRTGENTFGTQSVIFSNFGPGGQSGAAGVNGQNLGFINNALTGNFLIFNDRPSGTISAANISSFVKAVAPDGTSLPINWNGFSATSGAGVFDFSYDAGSGTLAISDSSNSRVYIFQVVPAPSAAALLGLGGLLAARRRR